MWQLHFFLKQGETRTCSDPFHTLIMITITSNVFIYIFQTVHFSVVKFAMGYDEKKKTFFWY